MMCEVSNCKYRKECEKWLKKEVNGNVTKYVILAVPGVDLDKLPDNCLVKKALKGDW